MSLCPNCFHEISFAEKCPHCCFEKTNQKQYFGVLPEFTELNGRYTVGRVLGRGGFGITYVAKDNKKNFICAIKEYMPSEYSVRSANGCDVIPMSDEKSHKVFSHGREKFLEEAKTLINLQSNPNVVKILNYFNVNNTAYIVMEFLAGNNLRQICKENGGKIDAQLGIDTFKICAKALIEIHKLGILHRDLSPENIIITDDGRTKMIDFGSARNYVSLQNKGMSILLKPGFAPLEQYSRNNEQGPWSDVYSLSATIYNIISGKTVPEVIFRQRGMAVPSLFTLGCNVSKKFSDIIEKGLELDYKKRYKNFEEMLSDLPELNEHIPQMKRKVEHIAPPVEKNSTKLEIKKDSLPVEKGQHTYLKRKNSYSYVRKNIFKSKHKMTYDSAVDKGYKNKKMSGIPSKQGDSTDENINKDYKIAYICYLKQGRTANQIIMNKSEKILIGRSPINSNFVITGDNNISRVHCSVLFDGKKFIVSDSRSTNGTFLLDGTRLVAERDYVIDSGKGFYLANSENMFIVEYKLD